MGKTEHHKQDLVELFDEFVDTGRDERITEYLLSASNLPGRRANLELARAFGDTVGQYFEQGHTGLWELCLAMSLVPAEEAPVNSPEEFIPFCGAIGLGAIGSASPQYFDQALATLRNLASDPRWRMREAVCFGLQRLMARQRRATLEALAGRVGEGDLLEMRATAAAVAEPGLLEDQETALTALQLHKDIIAQVLGVKERRSERFRILRKGLGYTLSVVVCAAPQEGFAFLAQLLDAQDPDVRWIVRENLKKNRLVRGFPKEVETLKILL